MAITSLNREARFVQNPALGASLVWRFACGYSGKSVTSDSPPLPLVFLVLPLLLHQDTLEMIAGTRAGLQAFADKFSQSENVQTDILLDIHARAINYRSLTLASLRVAIGAKLVSVIRDSGKVIALSSVSPSGVPASVKPLLANADKFGAWCSELTLYEIGTTLKVAF